MGRLQPWRYGLIGLLTLMLCLCSPSVVASLERSADLESLTAPARVTAGDNTVAQTEASLEAAAQAAYDQGDYSTAAALLEQAVQAAQQEGDSRRAAIALSHLSLARQQLGDWDLAAQAIAQAKTRLSNPTADPSLYAHLLDVEGQLQFSRGELGEALDSWVTAADLYTQLGDTRRYVISRLHQSQVLQAQGLFLQAAQVLKALRTALAERRSPSAETVMLLQQLGDSLRVTGDFDQATEVLADSLRSLDQLTLSPERRDALRANTFLSLGNVAQAQFRQTVARRQYETALSYAQTALLHYQRATQLSDALGLQASLNQMWLLVHPNVAEWNQALALYPLVKAKLASLSGRTAIYGYVGLTENLLALNRNRSGGDPALLEEVARQLLAVAHQQAQALGDRRAQSLVLGTLGHVYEAAQQWQDAERLSRGALDLSQSIRRDEEDVSSRWQWQDLSYRWQWQLGRILIEQQRRDEAISAYTEAFRIAEAIRSDLLSADAESQLPYVTVETLYREYADLLLSTVPELDGTAALKNGHSQASKNPQHQARLRQARNVIDSLQVAELESFFNANCIEKNAAIDQILQEDQDAALVHTLLMPDHLEVILTLPNQQLVHYTTQDENLDRPLRDTLDQYYLALTSGADIQAYGSQVYDWLLRPAVEAGLLPPAAGAVAKSSSPSSQAISTLIFAPDGELRRIPMATLYTGEAFLVEKYALSLILGLEIKEPQPLVRQNLQVLAAGLADVSLSRVEGYGDLPGVRRELSTINQTDVSVDLLQGNAFTQKALERQLKDTDYEIVHLATHGEFGRDRKDTFILAAAPDTGDRRDGLIQIDALSQIFRARRRAGTLELLILSACKTATGDDQEVLGIAGATVQAGAKSSIAALWSVDDNASVDFTRALYSHLGKPDISRAEALRRAQVDLLKRYSGRARYWAPYVLVGSWQ